MYNKQGPIRLRARWAIAQDPRLSRDHKKGKIVRKGREKGKREQMKKEREKRERKRRNVRKEREVERERERRGFIDIMYSLLPWYLSLLSWIPKVRPRTAV